MIDVGKLTEEETVDLFRECLNALPIDAACEAIVTTLNSDDKNDLIEWLEDNP